MHLVEVRIHGDGEAQRRRRGRRRFLGTTKLRGVQRPQRQFAKAKGDGFRLGPPGVMKLRIPLPINEGKGISRVRSPRFAMANK
jgi:hypothetical protein